MNVKARLLAAQLALLMPTTVLAYWLLGSGPEGPVFEPSEIPRLLGPYEAVIDSELDDDTLAMIQPDSYLMRLYTGGETGRSIWTYIAAYRSHLSSAAHDPEVCYPAQGWEVVGREELGIETVGGGVLTATLLRVDKDGQKGLVLYWFQPVGRWPTRSSLDQLLRIYDSVRGSPQFAFVRLSTPDLPGSRSQDVLIDFARTIGPRVREGLDVAAIPHPAKRDE